MSSSIISETTEVVARALCWREPCRDCECSGNCQAPLEVLEMLDYVAEACTAVEAMRPFIHECCKAAAEGPSLTRARKPEIDIMIDAVVGKS